MTVRANLAFQLLAAAALAWFALPSTVSAQDVMQLDYDFKNGQLGTHGSEARRDAAESRREVTVKRRTSRKRTVIVR